MEQHRPIAPLLLGECRDGVTHLPLPSVYAAHTTSPANPNIALTGSCPWLLCRSLPRPGRAAAGASAAPGRSPKPLLLCPNSALPCSAVFLLIRRACLELHRVNRVLRDLHSATCVFQNPVLIAERACSTQTTSTKSCLSASFHTTGQTETPSAPTIASLSSNRCPLQIPPWHRASRHPILPTGYPL